MDYINSKKINYDDMVKWTYHLKNTGEGQEWRRFYLNTRTLKILINMHCATVDKKRKYYILGAEVDKDKYKNVSKFIDYDIKVFFDLTDGSLHMSSQKSNLPQSNFELFENLLVKKCEEFLSTNMLDCQPKNIDTISTPDQDSDNINNILDMEID